MDSDWAGCSKTRKSTSGSTVNVLGCNVVSTARTQGTLALSSGEAELYAIGQGVSEALFVPINVAGIKAGEEGECDCAYG